LHTFNCKENNPRDIWQKNNLRQTKIKLVDYLVYKRKINYYLCPKKRRENVKKLGTKRNLNLG
jgi:hypothetical protein